MKIMEIDQYGVVFGELYGNPLHLGWDAEGHGLDRVDEAVAICDG